MTKRRVFVVSLVLALGLLGGVLAVTRPMLAAAAGRYPGAVGVSRGTLDASAWADGSLTWQVVYWTGDEPAMVEAWYARRMALPRSRETLIAANGCLMLTQAGLTFKLEHVQAVVICQQPQGTRVVVNDVVRWVK